MPEKACEVCGGQVRPLDAQSVLGYCENCGIVYVLRDRLKGSQGTEGGRGPEAGVAIEPGQTRTTRVVAPTRDTTPAHLQGSYWRCPDCGTEIRAANDTDLGFAKREHIREYHPNRSTG